ncbi:RteC domain-containing protein [Cellulophaga baltica]|uniref:RteC domain-containing protein n=1 Tax=Cellulophaga baltica TaxID=76594 RepID=UPI000407A1C8|nr:RteC domain-containing protein [Cellulophaga baltica]AIY12111.1 regulatory protein [Cellulophaga baltica NN016038]
MKLHLLAQNLEKQLLEIEENSKTIMQRSKHSIIVCTKLLGQFKKEIVNKGFDSISDEIYFFKHTKQIPLRHLIYFSEIRSFEIQFPKADKDCQRKFIRKKIQKVNRFFIYNLDFTQYTDSEETHFDKEYYTRDYMDSYHITTSKFYFQDPDFFTPRDMLLGKFRAYNRLVAYLDNRLHNLESSLKPTKTALKNTEKLIWPFTNTDWVELVYALSSAGVSKQNNLSISKVSKIMQEIFDFTPKDIYKTYQDIKNRKNSRTVFLDDLTTSLLSEMNKSEE